MNIPFSPPDISELEVQEVVDALRSSWITTGPRVKEFEKRIAAFCSVNRAVCLNSQTACAEMALRLMGIGPGDEGKNHDQAPIHRFQIQASCDRR